MTKQTPRFETERTRRFRAASLDQYDQRTMSHIEKFGCSILHITGKEKPDRPLFSYTVGVYDTSGQPEIITVGLLEDTAHSLLNSAVDELRKNVDLTIGRHRDVIGTVECEFRPVDPKWIKHLMGYGVWYYNRTDFPVLQAIYPDRENRFPENEGFSEYFAQPLLQTDAPMTRIEEDLWASNDPKSSLFDWKFPDLPHTRVFLSKTVHDGTEEVTYVSHDIEDGSWQFLGDLMDEGGGPVISCFHHPIDKDPSLKELADLQLNWYAERTAPGEPWIRAEHPPEESDAYDTETS